jgi:hypothetical protein
MAVIEGVVASVRTDPDRTVLTVYPISHSPERRITPERALDLVLMREPWQTDESHRDHANHMVGRGGMIEYAERGNVIALIRNH